MTHLILIHVACKRVCGFRSLSLSRVRVRVLCVETGGAAVARLHCDQHSLDAAMVLATRRGTVSLPQQLCLGIH